MPRLLSSIIIDLLVLVADSFCLPPGHHEMSGFFTMDRNVTKPPTLMALHHLRFGSWPRPAHLSPWTRQTHGHTCTKGAVRPRRLGVEACVSRCTARHWPRSRSA